MLVFRCFAVKMSDAFEVGRTVEIHALFLMILNMQHRYAYMHERHNVSILREELEETLMHIDAVRVPGVV